MLAACRRQPVDCTPVWFMRQAGRYLAAYRELRERYDILTLAKTPELCAQVTLMPVQELAVDAAVMFADIMLPLEGMGIDLEIEPDVGPIIHNPVRTLADVERLRVIDPWEATPFVMEAIRLVRAELGNSAALVGFSGAPFTLACYIIEGRPTRDYALAKGVMYGQPEVWEGLMSRLTEVAVRYLRAQAEAGAQVLQLFDSWVGALGPREYERYVLPHTRRIFEGLVDLGIPTIHFGTSTASLLESMAKAGGDALSLDWRTPLGEAWRRVGYGRGIQGNLDPARLLAPFEVVEDGMREVLHQADGRLGHIFNLGHGVLPDTPPAHLARLVEAVHQSTVK